MMKKKIQKLLLDIEAAEANLMKLKKQARAFNSVELKKDLDLLKNIEPRSADEYRLKLAEKEKLIQKTEEFSQVGRWSYMFENEVMEWSVETYKIFDYPEDYNGTLNEFFMSCIDEDTANRLPQQSKKLKNTRKNLVMNQTIHTLSGITKLISFSSSPIVDDNDVIIGVDGLVKDLTDRITGSTGLDNFFNLSYDLHCIANMDSYFVKVSPAWTNLLGYTEKELTSQTFMNFIHPDDKEKSNIAVDQLDEFGITTTFENRYLKKSGEVVYLSWNSKLDEETELLFCTARDITKSKLEKDKLLSVLSEKDLLLREIHHRVKNNMQIISSLLSLQAGANSDQKQLVKLYEDSRNRIKSMAAIHEMFYQSEELDKIEFGKYLDKLISDLSKSISSKQKSIDLNLDVEPVFVNLDTAVPLGLLINEIVTNSIKHGADKNGQVKIFVKLEKLKNGEIQLTIGDHGTNSSEDILTQSGDSLGLLLINSLVEQINGEIKQLKIFEGTVYQLIFSEGKQ